MMNLSQNGHASRLRRFLVWMPFLILLAGMPPRARAEEDPRVKVLMQEGLRLYGDKQYIRALDLFKQVERIQPDNEIVKDYIGNAEKRIQEWDQQGGEKTQKESGASWDSLLDAKKGSSVGESATNAKDIIAARKSLVDRMKNRTTNTDNIVKINDTKKGLEIILFHDQLFVPGLQILRDEALPILENVAGLIRDKGDRPVTIRSMARSNSTDPFLMFPDYPVPAPDPSLPRSKSDGGSSAFLFQDIEATRSFMLFTYLAQRSMGRSLTVSAKK